MIVLFVLLISCQTDKKESIVKINDSKIKAEDEIISSSKAIDSNQQTVNHQEKLIKKENFITQLKGGYEILYSTNDTDQYLIHKKGGKIIDTISSGSIGLLKKNIGYVVADFESTFVFIQSFGSGNPTMVKLFEKETAKNLINAASAYIAVDTIQKVVLYSEKSIPTPTDKMTLYDVNKRTKLSYYFPKEVFGEAEILNRISLKEVTKENFTLEFELNDYRDSKIKKYLR
jgi:hypothetical protein